MSSYVLVGAGGTGSHLLPALHRYLDAKNEPNWQLHIYDGDEVEEGNLARQIFPFDSIGKNKALAYRDILNDADHVFGYAKFIGKDDLAKVIQDGDIVLIGADNMFIRAAIEAHCLTLDNVVVINGGNEAISGSVQLWIREGGKNITPQLSWLHNEFVNPKDGDRSAMSCAQISALPGGEQTILANMTSANLMLAALYRYHQNYHKTKEAPGIIPWTEVQFDWKAGTVMPWDVRGTKGWKV